MLIGIFTFQAKRGYELARFVRKNSKALVVLGGLHASMNYQEAAQYCDYVLLGEGEESIPVSYTHLVLASRHHIKVYSSMGTLEALNDMQILSGKFPCDVISENGIQEAGMEIRPFHTCLLYTSRCV